MKSICIFLLLLSLVVCASGSKAAPIAYTEAATATGTLGSNSFADALVTLTATADTSAITSCGPGCIINSAVTATLNVSGLGSASFTDPVVVVAVSSLSAVAFGGVATTSPGQFSDILDTFAASLGAYGLNQSIGPITGSTNAFLVNISFATSSGDFHLSSARENQSTFEASVVATPLPAALPLFASGGALLGFLGWRRKRKAIATA